MVVPDAPRVPTAAGIMTLFFASVLLFGLTAEVQAQDQTETYKVLYSFTGGADGGQPSAGLVLDAAGNLFGTTFGGGYAGCFDGCGAVFELSSGSTGWSESTLYTFTGGSDGGNPADGLIFDTAGNLYATADVGGVSCGHTYGCGVAFELSPGSGRGHGDVENKTLFPHPHTPGDDYGQRSKEALH